MKRIVLFALVVAYAGLSSCDELGDLIPDIKHTVSESYTVVIEENAPSALNDSLYINIYDYEEFSSFEGYVAGYGLDKITYEISDYDAPEDLYFSGTIIAIDSAGTSEITVGTMPSMNLSDIATIGGEQDIDLDDAAVEELLTWIAEKGIFTVKYDFTFETANGEVYVFEDEDFGKSFTITVNLSITIKTGVSL